MTKIQQILRIYSLVNTAQDKFGIWGCPFFTAIKEILTT